MIPWLTSSSLVRLCWSLSWRTAWRQREERVETDRERKRERVTELLRTGDHRRDLAAVASAVLAYTSRCGDLNGRLTELTHLLLVSFFFHTFFF